MSIPTIITRGIGNGTFSGSPADIVTHGFSISAAIKYVSTVLVSKVGSIQATLSNLSWSWFDTSDIGTAIAPSDQGTGEDTDGTGVLTVDLPNTLTATGSDGILIVQSDDGVKTGTYVLEVQE